MCKTCWDNWAYTQQTNDNFYDSIIKTLRQEALNLNERLHCVRKINDMNNYIATLKSLKQTLELIREYDWKLMYSEYTTDVDGKEVKQIAVWQQNHDNSIKNHKVWNVIE